MKILRITTILILCMTLLIPCGAAATETDVFEWEISKEELLASLWEADITSIHEAYELGWITCTELTEYYLERIDTYNDTYNCFITLCDDALEQAAKCDAAMAAGEADGSLFGIPMVVKDNMDYAGYHTTNGHSKNSSQIADGNADVVEYILQEGAVIIGKTNMSTEAQDARASASAAVGETKNAYNSELAAGGSSGGSAVATSLNFALAGLGTDTNSSLRLPAILNGCISLRSTFGALSTEGIIKLNSTRDVPGVITRTVMDQAIILDVLSGGTTAYTKNLNSDALSGLRIGILYELSYAISNERSEKNIDDEVAAAFENAINELEACGAEMVVVNIPNVLNLAGDTLNTNKSSYKETMYNAIVKAMEDKEVSALIFPTYLSTPQRSGRDADGNYWSVWEQTFINNTSQFSSCASLPEIAVPIGQHSRGACIGMEIAALKNQEQLLLDIAYSYTLKYDHRQAPVNAPDLYTDHCIGTLSEVIADYHRSMEEFEEAKRLAEEEVARQEEVEKETGFISSVFNDKDEEKTPAAQNDKGGNEIRIILYILLALVAALLLCAIILYIRVRRERERRRKARQMRRRNG